MSVIDVRAFIFVAIKFAGQESSLFLQKKVFFFQLCDPLFVSAKY